MERDGRPGLLGRSDSEQATWALGRYHRHKQPLTSALYLSPRRCNDRANVVETALEGHCRQGRNQKLR